MLGRVGAQVLKSTIMSSTGPRMTGPHSPAPSSDRASGWSEVTRPHYCSSQWEALHWIGQDSLVYQAKSWTYLVSGGYLSAVTEGGWTELCIMDLYW